MLHMVADEAMRRGESFGVLLVDLEGQYKMTIEHAHRCFDMYGDYIRRFWVCLPLHLRNAVSVYAPHWLCWDDETPEAWIREPPGCGITEHDYFPFFGKGMEFEEFVPEFGE